MRVLVAGELNLDLILQNYLSFPVLGQETLVEDITLTLGSSGAICAAGLAKLGNDVSFTGKLGCDSWGDACLDFLAKLHVESSRVVRDAAVKTGITVSISGPRDRAMVTYLGAMEAMHASEIAAPGWDGLNHLHVSSIFLQRALRPDLKRLLAEAHAHGLTTSIDPGFDPQEQWGRDVIDTLAEADVFLPNEVELAGITGLSDPEEALRSLENERTLTVAKLGRNGCATLDRGKLATVPAFAVKPVDTTGAGDSFNAGFLHAWLRKSPLIEALRFGAACGAISTLASGGTTAQATEQQARELCDRP
ncbi:MAG TPA: carbohydrate kinase family protein [Bryobacteraceae bacterium]|nr:carbohydrate kinase family protein [Bryobacteraceae bacterium]